MQRIASGQFELRKVSEVRPGEQSNGGASATSRPSPHGGLASQIAAAMAARRNAAQLSQEDDADDSDEDW